MTCNIMSGVGFNQGSAVFGPWSVAWLGVAIVFFIALFANRWLPEFGINWNGIGAFAGGLIGYFTFVTLTCEARWAMLAGIVGVVVGGYILGLFIDSGGDTGQW